jgi:hypothetical protein
MDPAAGFSCRALQTYQKQSLEPDLSASCTKMVIFSPAWKVGFTAASRAKHFRALLQLRNFKGPLKAATESSFFSLFIKPYYVVCSFRGNCSVVVRSICSLMR